MTVPVPLVIAHRGASAAAPENTIAAFERALTDGADAIQLDVHLSRDDHPVVIHDPTLERTTNGSGPVRGHTMRELKRLDAGAWRGAAFAGQRLQTLQEVLERFRGRTKFWIELKGGPDLYPDVEERIVGLVEVYDVIDGALVQTFDPAALARLRAFSRELSLGAVLARAPLDVERDVPIHGEVLPLSDVRTLLVQQTQQARELCMQVADAGLSMRGCPLAWDE